MTDPDRLDLALKILRISRGMSQKDLAEASGIRNNAISKYESGKAIPRLDTLMRLTGGLSLPLDVVEQAKAFVEQVNAQAGTADGGGLNSDLEGSSEGDALALRREIERLSQDAGRVMTRYSALVLDLLSRLGSPPEPPPSQT
ncbi:MAG: helix-turn-helix transcriptional regulator [Acidobacteriota bacterium]